MVHLKDLFDCEIIFFWHSCEEVFTGCMICLESFWYWENQEIACLFIKSSGIISNTVSIVQDFKSNIIFCKSWYITFNSLSFLSIIVTLVISIVYFRRSCDVVSIVYWMCKIVCPFQIRNFSSIYHLSCPISFSRCDIVRLYRNSLHQLKVVIFIYID